MECENNGQCYIEPALQTVWRKGVKRKFGADVGLVRLDVATAVPVAPIPHAEHLGLVPGEPPPNRHHPNDAAELPFMSDMDEITYWIHTRRAPCLMNYDNLIKKQNEKTKLKPKSIHSVSDIEPSPKKKKKRKLSVLDDSDMELIDKQQNIYFESTPQKERPVLSSCKSDTLVSDIDFNIKKSSIRDKPKRLKLQKNCRTTVHKKNKLITSTPKVSTALRRSLRKAQKSINNNSQFNVSFEVYNASVIHGNNAECEPQKTIDKYKKPAERLLNGDRSVNNKKNRVVTNNHKNGTVGNGQFEDVSDVSGFTANYIRSTKIHSTKTPRALRSKGCRNLMKETQQNLKQDNGTMRVCFNKSMNTTEPAGTAVLNCSTDSSQNVINLITVQHKSTVVDRGTSLLKFIEAKTPRNKKSDTKNTVEGSSRQTSKTNILCKSRDSETPRYPKRNKNCSREDITVDDSNNQVSQGSSHRKRRTNKNSAVNNSDRKENPNESSVSRTRSGRCIGLKLQQPEKSVLVLNNATEQESSMVTINVAGPTADQHCDNLKKSKRTSCVKYMGCYNKSKDNKSGQSLRRDSLRDKSGFAACFSDSDDSEPLKQGKYFC